MISKFAILVELLIRKDRKFEVGMFYENTSSTLAVRREGINYLQALLNLVK